MMSYLLAFLLAAVQPIPSWSRVDVLGWAKDGTSVAYKGTVQSMERPDGVTPCAMVFLVVTGLEGNVQRLFRMERWQPMDEVTWTDERADTIWKAAGSEDEGKRWLASHPLVPSPTGRKLVRQLAVRNGTQRLTAKVSLQGKSCSQASLVVGFGSGSSALLQDPCPADGDNPTLFESTIQIAWSPDGARAALGWNVVRASKPQPGAQRPAETGYFAVAFKGKGKS